MLHTLIQRLWIQMTAVVGAVIAIAMPTPTSAMPSTKAIFFSSGIQQRLEVAIRSDDSALIDQLLSAGALVNARGLHDVTPLMVAVDAQSPRAVGVLLRAGANPNLKAADGAGAVHLAVESHAVKSTGKDILAMIMKAGGDPNTLRPDGDPVVVRFSYDHDLEDLRWFKAIGANLDIHGRTHRPIISDIAYGQNWDVVWVMIELGAQYDYENTVDALSKALDSPYASSPDSILYPYKLKVWQLFKERGFAVKPFASVKP